MTQEQYRAIFNYSKKHGYANKDELLKDLRNSGVLDPNSPLEDLAKQVADDTYTTMYNYLENC